MTSTTKNPIPEAGASFLSDLQTFLRDEDPDRFRDMFTGFIVSGGTHATGAGLIHTPASLTAYPGGHYITETGAITYPDSTTHIWVICHKDTTTTVTNWTRVSGTHYLFRNTGSGTKPALPVVESAILMKVTTSGGAVTVVEDQRTRVAETSGIISVKDPAFGAEGNGVVDDTTAIQAAIDTAKAAGGGIVFFPPGTYFVTDHILLNLADGVSLLGAGIDVSIIRASAISSFSNPELLRILSSNNFFVRDLTFDANENSSIDSGIGMNTGNDTEFSRLKVIKWGLFGIALTAAARFYITDNFIEITTAVNTGTQSLLITPAGGANTDGWILNNYLNKSAIIIDCNDCKIIGNRIKDWKFGGGITTTQSSNSERYTISENHISGGTGTDINGTVVPGIENWGAFSIISKNLIELNDGDGIDNGGHDSVVTDNICRNNGLVAGGSGIVSRYDLGAPTFNGNRSIVSLNRCFDDRSPKLQSYGYAEQNSSVQDIALFGNQFLGNLLAPLNILGARDTFVGPELSGSATWNPPDILDGTGAEIGVTVSGAIVGDFVIAAFSLDTQGMILTGRVSSANVATCRLQNETGGDLNLGLGTIRAKVIKSIDAPDY